MKKRLILIALIGLLALPAAADVLRAAPTPQAATVTATNIPPEVPNLLDYLTTGSNYFAVPFLTYSVKDHTVGGGIALGYHLTPALAPVLRLDYFSDKLYNVSLTANLQPPRALMGKVPIIPFALVGGATPLAGAGDENGTFVTVIGLGAYVPLEVVGKAWFWRQSSVVADYERWIGMPDNQTDQVRVGFSLRF